VNVAAKRTKPRPKPVKENREADSPVPGLAARKAAAKLLAAVIDAHTPLDGLTDNEHGHPQYRALEMRDRALVRAILATALRFRGTIERLIARRLERPLPANAHALGHVLHVAAAQILFLGIPDSAAVDLAVTHAKSDPRTARFSGLVNGVLRALVRVKDRALPVELARNDDAPEWLAGRLADAYGPGRAKAILAAHRVEAPIDFTVKSDARGWAEKLGGVVLPTGTVRVERLSAPVSDLPGFREGEWWVQDAAAALPARLLGEVSGLDVADLCAAPGGKTAQLALAGARVTAVDASKSRLKRLAANFDRLKLSTEIVEADVGVATPPKLFDAVLLDAPCSSTGTVRRHPDVPWTKSPEDIEKLTRLQRRLLARAVEWVKPGGLIVFSNCSLDPLEGEALLAAFLEEEQEVVAEPVQPGEIAGADGFLTPQGTLRTTPADMVLDSPELSGMDGFFAARMRRRG
jgi:16S rRNA (cytosine967-C5)-methyltransferase